MEPTSKKILGTETGSGSGTGTGKVAPEQNRLTKSRIRQMMLVAGLSASRVLFGARTDKLSHIQRYGCCIGGRGT